MRYWSWLFATREARGPLLGIYALMAEWHSLMDPGTEIGVARIKLAWWREELARMTDASPLHPITRYLADFPRAATTSLAPLARSVEAAAAQVAGVPLEYAAELASHADALYGAPLLVAAELGGARGEEATVRSCVAALGAAQYLARAIEDYGREARIGRIPFAVDALLAAGIDNDDLAAAAPPPRLQAYLDQLRRDAAGDFATAARALSAGERSPLRHLPVLAALGTKHLNDGKRHAGADFRIADLYKAWTAARRAAAAR